LFGLVVASAAKQGAFPFRISLGQIGTDGIFCLTKIPSVPISAISERKHTEIAKSGDSYEFSTLIPTRISKGKFEAVPIFRSPWRFQHLVSVRVRAMAISIAEANP
jgi:hypothetical protein